MTGDPVHHPAHYAVWARDNDRPLYLPHNHTVLLDKIDEHVTPYTAIVAIDTWKAERAS